MLANYHTHTWRCHHAVGTEREYVEAAIESGVKILGFSDHSPYLFPGDYYSHFRMRPEQLSDYVDAVSALEEEYRDRIQIHIGLELEYYPDLFGDLMEFLRDYPIEYLLLGQHLLGNEMGEFYSGKGTDDSALLRRYCRQTMEGMNQGVFTYLAHPDLFWFYGDEGEYRSQMGALCREAKACGMPLEINLLGLREGRHYPDRRFWEIAAAENCPVILGRDAHDPDAFRDRETEQRAAAMAEDLGLKLLPSLPLRSIR